MPENNTPVAPVVSAEHCPLEQLISCLITDSMAHYFNWKVVASADMTRPTFLLEDEQRLYLSQSVKEEDRDGYRLYTANKQDGKTVVTTLREELKPLDEPSDLRRLYWVVYKSVCGDKAESPLYRHITEYTQDSRYRKFGRHLGSYGPYSEERHISVKKLFTLCNQELVCKMFIKLLCDERGELSQEEHTRISKLLEYTIGYMRETREAEPLLRTFSFRSPTLVAKSGDGSGRTTRFDSGLHEISRCLCSYGHELQPLYGYWLTQPVLTDDEKTRFGDVTNRVVVLLLRGILGQEV